MDTTTFFSSETLAALLGLLILSVADLVTGVAAAIRTRTFGLRNVSEWVQSHALGKVLPIGVLLFLGQSHAELNVFAATAYATYVASTLASMKENLAWALSKE